MTSVIGTAGFNNLIYFIYYTAGRTHVFVCFLVKRYSLESHTFHPDRKINGDNSAYHCLPHVVRSRTPLWKKIHR